MIQPLVAALAVMGLGLGLTVAEEPIPAPAKADSTHLARLIAQLGSERYEDREASFKTLDAAGPAALDVLRKAAASPDTETRTRAGDLIERIEKRVESTELTQPKMVRLVYNDTPVAQAVQDMARKTGFQIQLDGDQAKLANRKITLDTGDVPFWQAVDQFCEKAGLAEYGSAAIAENTSPASGGDVMNRAAYLDWSRPGRPEMPLVFLDGKSPAMPTYYGGAVRVRVLPRATQSAGTAHAAAPRNSERGTLLTFAVSPEPKMGLRNILSVRVEKVLDEQGNELKPPLPYIYGPDDNADLEPLFGGMGGRLYDDGSGQRNNLSTRVPLRFQLPEGVKKLKEIHGYVAAEIMTPPMPLLTMDNILDAAGKTVNGKNGGSLKVSEVKRDDKGEVTLKVLIERPSTPPAGGFGRRVRMGRRGGMIEEPANSVNAVGRFLSLVDEKGQAFKLSAVEEKADEHARAIVEYQLTFQAQDGVGKPVKLVYSGRRKTTIDVPFVLKDVPVEP